MKLFSLLLLTAGALVSGESGPVLGWSHMVWQSMKIGGRDVPHAALMVEVAVSGLPLPALMQLDTGAVNWVYHKPGETLHERFWRGNSSMTLDGTVAGQAFHDEWFNLRGVGMPIVGGTPLVGTLGIPFFENRILILDFVGSRLAILSELPPEVERRASFTTLEYRNNKIFVTFTLNGKEEKEMFFDSGSSAFALSTTRSRWVGMTGRQPNDSRNEKWDVKSWDKTAHMVGAPMKGEMCFGGACLPSPLVFFESSGLEVGDFDHYPYKASGLFGNVAFDGRVTVIVDVPHRRFGLIVGSLGNLVPK